MSRGDSVLHRGRIKTEDAVMSIPEWLIHALALSSIAALGGMIFAGSL
jgi:hypothetical protein